MNKEEIKCITKEQLNQLEWSDIYEYGTTLAYELIERIDKVIKLEEEIMYIVNKVAITTKNVEVKAIRDRLENIFEILKGE